MSDPQFTIGVEEEYLVVDKETLDLVHELSPEFYQRCRKRLGKQVSQEMMRSQIEVVSKVHATVADARKDLAAMRRAVIRSADEMGLMPIASATHPFADWSEAIPTDKERYEQVANDLRAVGRRLVICGLHVHVGSFDSEAVRVDLMNRVTPFLPTLLALSTSSPFWRGDNTGLKCYRLAVYDALPRTGLPEVFEDGQYDDFVATLTAAGIIPNSSMVWWAIRPSGRFPTVELRVADTCSRMDDSMSVAALYQCLMRHLYFHPEMNADYSGYQRLFVDENRWRAQRYGTDGSYLDWHKKILVPFNELIDELLDMIAPDAKALGCQAEVAHAREIVQRGTSAHGQRRIYDEALDSGDKPQAALDKVVRWIGRETTVGL